MNINSNLKDQVAVITGGGGVLCSTFAKALAKSGVKVAVLDLNKDLADRVVKKIIEDGGTAISVECNVLKRESIIKAKDEVNKQLGFCSMLINGAGGNHPKGTTTKEYLLKEDLENEDNNIITFKDLEENGIEFVFNLNFLGTFMPSQVFIDDLIKTKGTILNVSSMNAFTPLTKIPAYSGAKAAISNFTKWLAVHLCKVNVRVNAIAPGFFLTKQNEKLLKNTDGSFTERAEKILSQTPMNRFGTPEELIGTLFFLLDRNASGFINGTVIPVDGGFSAYSGV